jgi:hypothetical protein
MKIEIKLPKKSTVLRYMGVMQLLFTFFALWFFKPVFIDWLVGWYCEASGWSPESVQGTPALVGMWFLSIVLTITWFATSDHYDSKAKK